LRAAAEDLGSVNLVMADSDDDAEASWYDPRVL